MKKVCLVLATICLGFIGSNAMAVDVSFTPRGGAGIMFYNLDWSKYTPNGGSITLGDASDTVFLANVGGTVSINRFYFDAYIQKTTEGEDDAGWDTNYTNTFEIMDYSFAFGYNVLDSLSTYVGWKGRQTDMEFYNKANDGNYNDVTFESQGFFIGAAYGFVFDAGTLSFNAAYVRLEGELTQDQIRSNGTTIVLKATDATSNGFTVGVAWKGFIGEKWSYTLTADWLKNSYDDFSFNETINGVPQGTRGYTTEIDEEAYTMKAMVSYYF